MNASEPLQSGGAVQSLAAEVKDKGWFAYSARSERGDWEIFVCRPNGSQQRNLTRTTAHSEFSPLFSPNGRQLLYRRMPREEALDNNHHGTQGALVMAKADGTAPEVLGQPGELTWASWSPDGRQIATLSIKGIFIIDLATRQVVKRYDRKGFFQQVTWSPDGKWLIGVANSFGASWSIARLNLATGEASAVNRVDCCTPDWFPDSQNVIFSWRPPGQKANKGYGWTQLWRADAEGKTRQLVYGEDGRHVYGGNVSPDGQYVLFTGNIEEDGDPAHAGAPMGLMRLRDAPMIAGESKDLRTLHPATKDGPALVLPTGWEPCWTAADIFASEAALPAAPGNEKQLSSELRDKGWLVFSAATGQGDWDLFLMRPDGSGRRRLTETSDYNEAGARFSPDGRRLLYYRMPKSEPVDNNTYGTFELVLADANGGNTVSFGNGFSWAAWGPDSRQIACLNAKGIEFVDVATRQVARRLPRKGMVQQLGWSRDGNWLTSTANGLGQFWNIGCMNANTGELQAVSEVERYNCTPDWFPDSTWIIYSRGIIPRTPGRAELWMASRDGKTRSVLYAEEERHIYGGCVSPDGNYVLFTRSVEDLGKVDNTRTTMAVIRRSDAPVVGNESAALRQRLPNARRGPWLDLGPGWEPHWTQAEIPASTKESNP